MGRRTGTSTAIGVLAAFAYTRTWRQADLAREVGVRTPALRSCLKDLSEWHLLPLEVVNDPPDVYYRVPKDWKFGSIILAGDDLAALVAVLHRAPKSAARERLLKRFRGLSGDRAASTEHLTVPEVRPQESAVLDTFADAATSRTPLRIHHYSAARGELSYRTISVARLVMSSPARAVAYCHRAEAPRWFRLDNVLAVTVDNAATFFDVSGIDVDAFIESSVSGYRASGDVVASSFQVRDPEARWVERNLLSGMHSERLDGGVRVRVQTPAVLQVARFVIGLGSAARPETPELLACVRAIAEDVLNTLATTKPLKKQA